MESKSILETEGLVPNNWKLKNSTFSLPSLNNCSDKNICNDIPSSAVVNNLNINLTNLTNDYSSSFVNSTELPPSLGFDENAKKDIIVYSVLFVVAAIGNLTVFFTLFRCRHWKSRVNLMIMHLAAADLMVTFIMIPLEVGWRATTQWVAGNLACKIFLFLRAFGLYLSSMVLVCISLDRYFAILHPLKVNDAQRRGKMMLGFAWTTAAVCSLPQSIIFHVDTHPKYPSYTQCVTFGFFKTEVEEIIYNLFCLFVMYFLPLFIIIVVYVRILWEISQKSKDSREENDKSQSSGVNGGRTDATRSSSGNGYRMRLRRSDMTNIERARSRTLKMTIIIVLAFIWCWTPYVVIVMWYMFDRESAEKLDTGLQDTLFIMAVSNSCVNPLVYGTYNLNLKNELARCFGRRSAQQSLVRRPTGSTALRTTASTAGFNSSVTSRHALHAKVLDCGGYVRSNRMNYITTEEANLARRASKASNLAETASANAHCSQFGPPPLSAVDPVKKQEYTRGRLSSFINPTSNPDSVPLCKINQSPSPKLMHQYPENCFSPSTLPTGTCNCDSSEDAGGNVKISFKNNNLQKLTTLTDPVNLKMKENSQPLFPKSPLENSKDLISESFLGEDDIKPENVIRKNICLTSLPQTHSFDNTEPKYNLNSSFNKYLYDSYFINDTSDDATSLMKRSHSLHSGHDASEAFELVNLHPSSKGNNIVIA